MKLGYDMNAREELIRSYNEKEILLNETIEKEKGGVKNLKMETEETFVPLDPLIDTIVIP